MLTPDELFSATFAALTGQRPYHWQAQLFTRLIAGDIPPACSLPTGTGKTSVITVWLIALGRQAMSGQTISLPRRLVYVVDRRTVVDQSTWLAEQLAEALAAAPTRNSPLQTLAQALSSLSCQAHPSRLR